MANAKKKNLPEGDRLIAQNRRARHEFELGKSFEAGVALIGSEARALREGPADITDAWVEIRRGDDRQRTLRFETTRAGIASDRGVTLRSGAEF